MAWARVQAMLQGYFDGMFFRSLLYLRHNASWNRGGGDDYIYSSDTDVPRENQRRAQSRGRFSHKLPTQIRGKSYML